MKKILWCLFFISPLIGNAGNIIWDGKTNFISIGDRLEILEDKQGNLNINQVYDSALAGRFVKSNQKILSFGFSSNPRWLKFSFQNNTDDTLLLVLAQAVLPVADLYFKNDLGQWQCYKAGYKINLTDKPVHHHFQVYTLPAGNREYFVRLVSFSPPVPVKIWKAGAYEVKSAEQKMAYGIYIGILLCIAVLNIFLFFSLKSFTFFHYSVVVFLYLALSSFVMDGYAVYFISTPDLAFTYTFLPIISSINIILYAHRFLEVKKYAPRLYKFSLFILAYFSLYATVYVFVPQKISIILNQIDALVIMFLMIFMGTMVGPAQNKIGYYFAAAYLIYLFLVIFEIIYIQTGTPQYVLGLSHVSWAILIEALLLAYLLARRFSWEKAEIESARQETQTLLLNKTRENEHMIRDQNIRLEETVKQRTLVIEQQKETVEKMLSEKEVLLKEIHHRVKNNLQTISSMLMLQSAGLKDEEAKKAITESRTRVSSIALIHQKLYQTDGFEKVELNGFIKDMAEQLQSVYSQQSKRVTIHWNIPETFLLIDIAIPLGLIVNELFTNSFKYAFNDDKPGNIGIELNILEDENTLKTKKLVFKYCDSGPGLSSAELITTSPTLGLRLINLLSQQIGATINYDNSNGSEFTFTFNINI